MRRDPHSREEDWNETERLFQLKQLAEKSILRIREGRGTLFDCRMINTRKTGLINRDDPTITDNLKDEEGLKRDIEDVLQLESDPLARDYWVALQEWLAVKNQTVEGIDVVREDIEDFLRSKSLADLTSLLQQTQQRQANNSEDPEYWTAVLVLMRQWRARQYLLQVNQRLLEERDRESSTSPVDWKDAIIKKTSSNAPLSGTHSRFIPGPNMDTHPRALQLYKYYDARTAGARWRRITDIADPQVKSSATSTPSGVKPLYIAHEISQIVWTRYNQAHYSSNNPPPPIIQGYRFLVFYPEATVTPIYQTDVDPDAKSINPSQSSLPADGNEIVETQLVRFVAPPYRDLVFRIPAHPWELSHKHGFRCTFDSDTLSLHFRFRRLQYRR